MAPWYETENVMRQALTDVCALTKSATSTPFPIVSGFKFGDGLRKILSPRGIRTTSLLFM